MTVISTHLAKYLQNAVTYIGTEELFGSDANQQFNSLLFLYRDWEADDVYGHRVRSVTFIKYSSVVRSILVNHLQYTRSKTITFQDAGKQVLMKMIKLAK